MTGRTRAVEFAVLVAFGFFLATIEAFETGRLSAPLRFLYWQMALMGGGAIAILIEHVLARYISDRPLFFAVAQLLLMTPPIAVWVSVIPTIVFGTSASAEQFWPLVIDVMSINVAIIALAVLTRHLLTPVRAPKAVEGVAPSEIRSRLTPRLARARLLAVQSEDHYLRVRTDAGSALILMRLADALAALEDADGFRVHRSWWVARTAVHTVRWKAGRGEFTLSDGAVVPVSRTYTGALRGTDWAAPVS
jgi:DNA-binding LytR/AlgR family response regulator